MSIETEQGLVRDAAVLRRAVEAFYNAMFHDKGMFSTKPFEATERLFRALEMVKESEAASEEAMKTDK